MYPGGGEEMQRLLNFNFPPLPWYSVALHLLLKKIVHHFTTLPVSPIESGCGGVLVSALDFRSEGRRFDAHSLPLCCFFRQDTLSHFVCLYPAV